MRSKYILIITIVALALFSCTEKITKEETPKEDKKTSQAPATPPPAKPQKNPKFTSAPVIKTFNDSILSWEVPGSENIEPQDINYKIYVCSTEDFDEEKIIGKPLEIKGATQCRLEVDLSGSEDKPLFIFVQASDGKSNTKMSDSFKLSPPERPKDELKPEPEPAPKLKTEPESKTPKKTEVKPIPKTVTKPKTTTKPKATAKPKVATKPKTTDKPKVTVKKKPSAKAKTVSKPKATVKPKTTTKPSTAATPKNAAKPKVTFKSKSEPVKISQTPPSGTFTPQKAVELALAGPLELVSFGMFKNDKIKSCLWKNADVLVLDNYCTQNETVVAGIGIYSARLGHMYIYTEPGKAPSRVRRDSYDDFVWNVSWGMPDAESKCKESDIVLINSMRDLIDFEDNCLEETKFCTTYHRDSLQFGFGRGSISDDIKSDWKKYSEAFWKNPPEIWYRLLKELVQARTKVFPNT